MPIAYTRSAPQTHAIFLYVSIIFPSLPGSRFEKSCSPLKIRFRPPEEVSFPEKIVTVRYTWKATGRRKGAKKEMPSYLAMESRLEMSKEIERRRLSRELSFGERLQGTVIGAYLLSSPKSSSCS
jgi:hypothetical protein